MLLPRELAEEAAPVARVAGGAGGVDLVDEGVGVAVHEDALDALHEMAKK